MTVTTFNSLETIELFERKSEEYKYNLYPAIINLINNSSNKKVLDVGCGGGILAFELSSIGANVTGIDISKRYISLCRQRFPKEENPKFLEIDARDLSSINDNSFDIVIINMVFLALNNKKDLEKIFSESVRVLKSGGNLIFSDLHPICIMTTEQPTRKVTYSKGFSYFKEGLEFSTTHKLLDGKSLSLINKHWTIQTYMNLIHTHKLKLTNLVEPQCTKNSPYKLKEYTFPEYIIFNCQK